MTTERGRERGGGWFVLVGKEGICQKSLPLTEGMIHSRERGSTREREKTAERESGRGREKKQGRDASKKNKPGC